MIGLLAWIQNIVALPQVELCLRLLVAILCGAALGTERTLRSKDAGIRTHAILAGGAALFMIISKYAFLDIGNTAWSQGFDPTLVAGFIIDGSGFLCAGIIFNKSERDTISGLTTAAGIWATAAVGMACGCGMPLLAVLFTVILLINHQLLYRRGLLNYPIKALRLTIENTPQVRALLHRARDEYGIQIVSARYSRSNEEGTVRLLLQIRTKKNITFEDTMRFLDHHPEVKDISF